MLRACGSPGHQALSGLGSNGLVEVWTKPIGKGRTAAFIVNTADKDTDTDGTGSNRPVGVHFGARSHSAGGNIVLEKCDPERPSQSWLLSPGVAPGGSAVTNVKSGVGPRGGCWEITACSTHPNAAVGTGCESRFAEKSLSSFVCAYL